MERGKRRWREGKAIEGGRKQGDGDMGSGGQSIL